MELKVIRIFLIGSVVVRISVGHSLSCSTDSSTDTSSIILLSFSHRLLWCMRTYKTGSRLRFLWHQGTRFGKSSRRQDAPKTKTGKIQGVPPTSHTALDRIIYAIFQPLFQIIQCSLHWDGHIDDLFDSTLYFTPDWSSSLSCFFPSLWCCLLWTDHSKVLSVSYL